MPIQSKKTTSNNFECKASGDGIEMMLYGPVGRRYEGGVDPAAFVAELNRNKSAKKITLRINSPGGEASGGIAIYNALRSHGAEVTTIAEGLAASAASIIFMSGDERQIHPSAALMIHDASGITMGNAHTHERQAKELNRLDAVIASVYAERSGGDKQTIRELMDEDHYMYGEEAVADGYATSLFDGEPAMNALDLSIIPNVPQEIADRFGRRETPPTPPENHDMTPDEFKNKHKDVVEGWLNEEAANAYSNAKTDLTEMIEACGGDKAAAAEAFLNGKSVQDAKDERSQTLAEKLAAAEARAAAAEAKAKELENGADPLKVDASAEIKEEPTEDDEKKAKVQAQAAKIKGDYARNAYIESLGLNPADFKFD